MKIFIVMGVIVVIFILWFLGRIKVCEGGKIMQGCGRLIFPWQFKVKIKDSYCCRKCFIRDYELCSGKILSKSQTEILRKEIENGIYKGRSIVRGREEEKDSGDAEQRVEFGRRSQQRN